MFGSPFYGQRRPLLQHGAKLLCVSDLLLLGSATIEEARSLLHWLDSEEGFGKMGVCGLSMGNSCLNHLLIIICYNNSALFTIKFGSSLD